MDAQGEPMKNRIDFSHAAALVAFAPAPGIGLAQEGVSVAQTDTQEPLGDPAPPTVSGAMVELRATQNFASPPPAAKKNKTSLSSQSTCRVDCSGRKVAYKEIQAFPEADVQGNAVHKATFYEKNVQWMDAAADAVVG